MFIVYLKVSLKCTWYITYIFKSTLKATFSCKEYNLIKIYNKLLVIQESSLIIIDDIVLQFPWFP